MYVVETKVVREIFEQFIKSMDEKNDSSLINLIEDLRNKILAEEEWVKRPEV